MQHWSGAVMCPASHDGVSVKSECWRTVIQGGALNSAGFPAKPHIRRELIPTIVPHSGTGELQENGTTLYKRRLSATPNNGDVPSDRPDCSAFAAQPGLLGRSGSRL